MPPPITSGLLWSTDVAIEFATSGPAVPAIAMPRAAGPLYVVISYSQAATPGEDEPAIFYIGNPADNLWLTNTFYAFRNHGDGLAVATTPGTGKIGDLPTPPSDFVGEMWASTTDSNIISHGTPRWWFDPIPDHNPVATSHLFIGYKPNDGDPFWRGAGTIRRMAIYDRVPTAAERTQLVEWVQSEDSGDPEISGALAASSSPAEALFSASVAWSGIAATLSAISPASAGDFAGWVNWPRVEGSMDASSPESLAAFEGQVRWPGISAELSGTSPPVVADGFGRVATTAQLVATSPMGQADFEASVRWPSVSGGLAAEARPSVAQGEAVVGVAGGLAAHSPPPVAMFWAGSGWVPVAASLEAVSPVSLSAATVAVGNSASLHGTGSASVADFAGAVRWAGIEAMLDAISRGSHAAMRGHVRTSGWLAVAGESGAAAAVGAVGVRAALDAFSPQSVASIIEGRHVISERYAYPGHRGAGAILNPGRPAGSILNRPRGRGRMSEVR